MGLTGAVVKLIHNTRNALKFLKYTGANLLLLGNTIFRSAPFRELCHLTRKKRGVMPNEGIEPIPEQPEEESWNQRE